MTVIKAEVERSERYDRWYHLLLVELDLVTKPSSKIFAVGNDVAKQLRRREFPQIFTQILHYGRQAANARATRLVNHMDEFRKFENSVVMNDLIETALSVVKGANVPECFWKDALTALEKRSLTLSQKMLIFNYKMSFKNQ